MATRILLKKLRNTAGETLIESLVSLLIATLVLFFLATAVVTATNVNSTVENTDISFNYPNEQTAEHKKITVTIKDGSNIEVGKTTATQYTDDTGYYTYYKEETND